MVAAFLMLYQTERLEQLELLERVLTFSRPRLRGILTYYFLLAKNPAVLVKSEELRVKK